MQELTSQPQMMSPFTGQGSPYSTPMAPRVGASIPGTTGGLPAQSGLSVYNNPMAQQLQSMGRGEDTQLVHMTPREVQSLRGLAQLTGGDLSTNPDTGLPEAGLLGNLLPTILGALGAMVGIPPVWLLAGGTAAGTAATGNLGKGLMMGLGAFGGAGLAGALGGTGAISNNLFNTLGKGTGAAASGAANAANIAVNPAITSAAGNAVGAAGQAAQLSAPLLSAPVQTAIGQIAPNALQALPQTLANPFAGSLASAAGTGTGAAIAGGATPAVGGLFADTVGGEAAKQSLGLLGDYKAATNLPFLGKMGATLGPIAGGLGVLNALSPTPGKMKDEEETTNFPYEGPYYSERKQIARMPIDLRGPNPSGQQQYFEPTKFFKASGEQFSPGTPTTPKVPFYSASTPTSLGTARQGSSLVQPDRKPGETMEQYLARITMGGQLYAKGGEMPMEEGSFIFPARETAEIGNGSSRAGQEVLARLGGRAIDGKGDGVSDSIRARIGNKQEARVARDEVKFGPEAVTRLGKGSHSRGTQKLYSLMARAAKARKSAKRGQDTGLRRGLA